MLAEPSYSHLEPRKSKKGLGEAPLLSLFKEVWRHEASILKIKRPLYSKGSLFKTRGIIDTLRGYKSLKL